MLKEHGVDLGAVIAFGGGMSEERLARQLAERRGRRGFPKELGLGESLQLVELFSSTASFCTSWLQGRRFAVAFHEDLVGSLRAADANVEVMVPGQIKELVGTSVTANSGGGAGT